MNKKSNTMKTRGANAPPAHASPADAALAASELRYRRLFETAKDGILILDAETGMVMDVNPFLMAMTGRSREQFLQKAVWELGFLKDAIASREKFLELQRKEYVRYENLPLEAANGRRVEVEFVSNVYLAGQTKVIQCNIRDITARRQAESRQKLTAQTLAILNRDSNDDQIIGDILTLIKDHTGIEAIAIRLRDGDDFPYYAASGFPAAFLDAEQYLRARATTGELIRDAAGRPVLRCMCGNVLAGRYDATRPFFTANGSFWTNRASARNASMPEREPPGGTCERCIMEGYESIAIIPLRCDAEVVGLLQLNDHRSGMFTPETMTFFEEIGASIGIALARQRALSALKEREEWYCAMYVESRDAIMTIAPGQGYTAGNQAAIRLFACRNERDFTSRTPASLSPERQPDGVVSADKMQQMMRLAMAKGMHFFNWTHRRADGTDFPATVLLSRMDSGGQPRLQATVRDITGQLQMELQLRQAQKMEAVGRLAGGIAHDFNNLITGIMGCADLCRDKIEPAHPIREWLDEITHVAKRSAEITRKLLAFARKQTIAPKVLDLNTAVDGMLKLLRRLIGEDINLTWLPDMDLQPVRLDPSQVDQILANLCINARDAIAGVGKITLETGNIAIDAEYCAKHTDAIPGAYVFLTISDDGAGMDAATLAHIFEPYFTTKDVGKGTGLGLATVYGIVRQNNGFIQVASAAGQGTTITIHLPRVVVEAAEPAATGAPAAPGGQGETIMLVEDEKLVRVTCERFLSALGYKVLAMATPEEALRAEKRHTGDIHLLLTDVVMPGMDGRQLAQCIRATRPATRVLFMSGYTDDVINRHGVLEQDTPFIAKPFTREELASKVYAVMEIHQTEPARQMALAGV